MKPLLPLIALLITSVAALAGEPLPALLAAVSARLDKVLDTLTPRPEIVLDQAPGALRVEFQTKIYKVTVTESDEQSKRTVERTGPTETGFVLIAQSQSAGYRNQLVTPQTFHEKNWNVYIQVSRLSHFDSQLYWILLYGSQTDAKTLARIHEVIDSIGDITDKPAPGKP